MKKSMNKATSIKQRTVRSMKSSLSLRNCLLVAEFEMRSMWANKAGIVNELFLQPISYILLLAGGLSGILGDFTYEGRHLAYITYVYPGILGMQLLRSFTASIYRITLDRRWGLQGMKLAAGTGLLGYMLALLIAPVAIFVLQSAISLPVALLMGAHVTMKGFMLLQMLGMTAVVFWISLAMMVTFLFQKYSTRDLFLTFTILPMTLASPAFYVLDRAPHYLQFLGSINPLSYQIIAMREAFLHQQLTSASLICVAISALMFALAFYKFHNADYISTAE